MKVLMISDFFGENLDYQENFIGETLVKQGHEVVIVTSTFSSVFDYYADKYDETAPSRTYVAKGMKIVRLQYRYNFLQKVRRYPAIDGILDSEQPDLIFAHDITLNFPECIRYMKRYPKCRMIMDYHADSSNSGKNWPSRAILHGVIRKHFLNSRSTLSVKDISSRAGECRFFAPVLWRAR